MVYESNEINLIKLQDGTDGVPGKNGETLYTWVKYSQYADGTDMTDDPTDAIYIGISYNNESSVESSDKTFYTWARIKGEDGDNGVGIQSVDVWYYLSSSSTSLSDGKWSSEAPAWENGKYLWSKTITTYTNEITSESNAVCITGEKGKDGDTGKGVSKIVEQYYLSSSNTTQTGGSWSITSPSWKSGYYIWTRSEITWTDNSVTYTTAVLANALNDANSNANNALDTAANITPFITGTQTSATGAWTGIALFSELKDGQQITYWLPYAGNGNATLNLTLSDGSTTGAIACYYGGTTRLTTHYPAGSAIRLTYRSSVAINGTNYSGWWADANYDSGNTYDRTRFAASIKAESDITAGNIIVGNSNGYHNLKTGESFDVSYPILWAGVAMTAGSTGYNNYIIIPCGIAATQSLTLTAYKSLYIKGTLSGSTFTPISTAPITQTIPTTDDGYCYILLGTAYSTTAFYLLSEHPIFKFINGMFQQIDSGANSIVDEWRYEDTTEINGGSIRTGTITADKINVKDLFSQTITATGTITGINLVGGKITSLNYEESIEGVEIDLVNGTWNSPYFQIDKYGSINSTDGNIGGFYIGLNCIRATDNYYNSEATFYISSQSNTNYWLSSFLDGSIIFTLDQVGNFDTTGVVRAASVQSYSGANLDEVANKLSALKNSPFSVVNKQTVTTTQTTYSTYNSRKFSDYDFLTITMGTGSDYRQSITIPTSIFRNSTIPFYLDCNSNNGATFNQIAVKFVSDTSYIAYATTSSTVVKVLEIFGYKLT